MTDREELWAGEFGTEYHKRNPLNLHVNMWKRILRPDQVKSAIELGAGCGHNLVALKALSWHGVKTTGVEINKEAANAMRNLGVDNVVNCPVLSFVPTDTYDMVITRGFLIHLSADELMRAFRLIANLSSRYVVMAEYYSPTTREVKYHGHGDALWARDFAGLFMERYPYFKLIDYGFVYRGDPVEPQDDITWFLMERQA